MPAPEYFANLKNEGGKGGKLPNFALFQGASFRDGATK